MVNMLYVITGENSASLDQKYANDEQQVIDQHGDLERFQPHLIDILILPLFPY